MNNAFTILIVDDSQTQLAVLEDALEQQHYRVLTASNGREAITRVYQSHPDLVLSDVMMPELNGYSLCRLLKNDPATSTIPVILLTNLKERHDRFLGEHAGADCYLEKQSDLTPILEAIPSLLPPSPGESAPAPSRPHRPLGSEEIQNRLTTILDRLLYESTISNEVLKLTGLAHDIDALAAEFLGFLSAISQFSAASLLLRDGRDKYVLAVLLCEPVSRPFLDRVRHETLRKAGLGSVPENQVRTLLLGDEKARDDSPEEDFQVFQALPIVDNGLQALVALFNTRPRTLSEGSRHALLQAVDRFLIVARYLRNFKKTEEVKTDFVSMLIHDMRSPLTSISGFTDVLSEGILGPVSGEQKSALNNIRNGCERLLLLIDDIMDFSKLEAGKMQLSTVPVKILPLAEQVVGDLAGLFREKDMNVHIDIPEDLPPVNGDPKQLARVFSNLLSNAVKFTPAGGKIVLSAAKPLFCPTKRLKDCLEISLSDTGSGIPPEQQQNLFQRYQQLSSTSVFRKGTGLGLAICKEIVTLHGGEIWAESPVAEGRGSRFAFTLPLAPA
ncbi:hybrid sensor histidine kinase/response regulator [uncultured Desulfuromonas sp.]|uniref:hybrid sensor histidine kinase/response regulator n=1 Tax=uncultured Desulfuromonas sp. TaxID=181013 RepID=UPI002632E970|nr:hybrid sensor histidine kinase/response regulator [uncultured Desulfuromonas sp.]